MVNFIKSKDKGPPLPDPYPKVNWESLKPHLQKQLPVFSQFPISGCPQDPYIYPDHPNLKGRVMHCTQEKTFNRGPESTPEDQTVTELLPVIWEDRRRNFKILTYGRNKTLLREQEYEVLLSGTARYENPFGSDLSYQTSLGVVAPTHPVNGYISKFSWLPHASPGQGQEP